MTRLISPFAALLLLVFAGCSSPDASPPDTPEGRAQAVDALVQDMMAASDVPGASVAIVHHGDVVYQPSYGVADRAAERVEALGRVVGWTGEVVPLPAEQLPEHLHAPFDWHYELATDTRRLYDELGFQPPVTFEEALRRTAAWERAQCPADAEPPTDEYAAEDAALRQAC